MNYEILKNLRDSLYVKDGIKMAEENNCKIHHLL
jgi:hypothetical protein